MNFADHMQRLKDAVSPGNRKSLGRAYGGICECRNADVITCPHPDDIAALAAQTAAPGAKADILGSLHVTPEDINELAKVLAYPSEWDTIAYPDLGHALIEFVSAASEELK